MLQKIKTALGSVDKKRSFLNLIGLKSSYSQCGEDIILDFFINKNKGFYVDIGANEPKELNNFFFFYKKGWNGINVEPNYELYKKLSKQRPNDINLNLGIGNGEELLFQVMKPHTLSTFDLNTAKSYIDLGYKLENEIKVKTLTLESLFDKYIGDKHIDILSVDVEGFDMQVLQSNNWNKYKPDYIILETVEHSLDATGKKLNDVFDKYLFGHGYEVFADTYINTIYRLRSHL